MKVLVLTEGGTNIGLGHITRCLALCEAFKERKIYVELFVNVDKNILSFKNYNNFKRYDWIKEKEDLFAMINKTDVVVIDSYLSEKSLYYKISKITKGKIIILDDYNRINYPKGMVISPSIYGDKLKYPKKTNIIYLLGKDYIILRKEFWNTAEKKINKEINSVLITFGGTERNKFIEEIADFIKKNFVYKLNIINTKNGILTAEEILNLMVTSDICISGGGQTTNELARVGVPTIGICFAENQMENILSWEENGFLKFAGWFSDKDLFKKVKEKINELNFINRAKICEIGKKLVDGMGARKIVNKVLEII
jgi:UDP-2,4-diacetamido-2,4,6-trideoxy-beta-L-altropyranose hydrolase